MPNFMKSLIDELDEIAQAILDHGADTIWLEDTETAYDALQRLRAQVRLKTYIITAGGPKDALHIL
jgi:2-methylisocitrate lyase-like PEP mutase family enzyme